MKFVWIRGLLIFALLVFTTHALASTYIAKKGDTIANIARAYYGEPVFGPKGTVNRIYQLNPSLKTNPTLEPGQKIALEEKPTSKALTAQAAVPAPADATLGSASEAINETPVLRALEEARRTAMALPIRKENAPPLREEAHIARDDPEPIEEKPHNSFWFIPGYALLQQKATEVASGTSYSISSSPAISAELGWDRRWNDSFTTILTYSITQLSTAESSDLTGSKVIDGMLLSKAEISLLNQIVSHLKFGFGLSYGDHIFLETFTATPVDPSIYKIAYLNPFAQLEWAAFEAHGFEGILNLKAGALPAQVGHGHDLTSGYELSAETLVVEKFEKWGLIYGVTYTTENQTRTDSDETANKWDFRIGALF